jgi:hypothetical protein
VSGRKVQIGSEVKKEGAFGYGDVVIVELGGSGR